jgi:chaperone required for assembly of F1-ATPase
VKRFWKTADIGPVPGGYAILLDGKPMRLPGGDVLCVEAERLARAIAEEWQRAGGGKGGEMSFADTPLTRLAGTAQQRIAPDPAPTVDAIARSAETNRPCDRARERSTSGAGAASGAPVAALAGLVGAGL